MKRKRFLQYLLLILLSGCSNSSDNSLTVKFYESDFPEKIKLTGVEMLFDSLIWNPYGINVRDSFLYVRNGDTQYFFDIFRISESDTCKFVHHCLTYGNGPNDRLYPVIIPSNDSNIWIYDFYSMTLSKYDSIEFHTNTMPVALAKYDAHYQDRKVTLLDSQSFLIASQNLHESRFSIFSFDGQLVKQIGVPMFDDKTVFFEDIEIEKILNVNKNIVTNGKDRIIVSFHETDLIEIFDFDGNKIKQIFGPNQYLPNVNTNNMHDCYTNSQAVDSEVWLKYSGRHYRDYDSHANYIHVFDWDGTPLRIYELDIPIIFFAVDSEKRIIYGTCNQPECRIIKYKY
jgi:hypothetical protein